LDVYARLSFAPGGDTINVDDQEEWCTEAVVKRGGVVGEVFKDNSLSAWDPKVVRPDWNRLMARLEAGESNGVMVLDLTRFSRKVMEGERLVELAARGVLVWSLSGTYDLTSADGRRHFREAMVAAAGESDKISERVKRGHLRGARRGRRPGGRRGFGVPGWAPVGSDWEPGDFRDRVSDDAVQDEKDVIRECYRRLLAGEHISSVVRDLIERGIRTLEGNVWRRNPLVRSLRRPVVAGLRKHNGEVIGVQKDVTPIVSREQWERLCALFDGRKRGRPPGRVHLLAGLVRCSRCGLPMVGMYRRALPPYPGGGAKYEYRCLRVADRPDACGKNYIDGRIADAAVAEAVKARLGDPAHADQVARRLAATSDKRAELTTEITRLNDSADNLADKTAAWGTERVDRAMAPILQRLDVLNSELAGLDDAPGGPVTVAADMAADWDRAAEDGGLDTMRAMIRRAFPRLALRPQAMQGDFSVTRFDWDGATLPEKTPAKRRENGR
jgi:DNA invertase Pin-like site-specific DNA recombinase